jgi:hypothetical protein
MKNGLYPRSRKNVPNRLSKSSALIKNLSDVAEREHKKELAGEEASAGLALISMNDESLLLTSFQGMQMEFHF